MRSTDALLLLLLPALLAPSLAEAQQRPLSRMARAPAPAQRGTTPAEAETTYPFVTFTIVTGGDDLRSDSLVTAQVAFFSDHTEQNCVVHGGAGGGREANSTWDNQSPHDVVCELDKPRSLEELKHARWSLRMLGDSVSASPDNWNIKSILVWTSRSRSAGKACIVSVGGSGIGNPDLIRLTGSQPTVTLSSYPNRCG